MKGLPIRRRRAWLLFLAWTLAGAASSTVVAVLLERLLHSETLVAVTAGNQRVMEWVHGWTTPRLTLLMVSLSILGSWKVLVPASGVVAAALVHRGRWREVAGFMVAFGGANWFNHLLKGWFARPRPSVAWAVEQLGTFSFPSGHAVTAVVFFGMLAWIAGRRRVGESVPSARHKRALLIAGAALLSLAIGVSRVYLGVHYPGDVLGGFIVGALWLAALIRATGALEASARR